MNAVRERWTGSSPLVKVAIVVAVGMILVNLLSYLIDDFAGGRRTGPPSSTLATDPTGAAAYVELLERHGHRVDRSGVPPSAADLDSGATVFVLDAPEIDSAEVAALKRFVEAGGRLVMGGSDPRSWFGLIEHLPEWGAGSPAALLTPVVPVPEVREVSRVASKGAGSWTDPSGLLPILGAPAAPAVGVASPGSGRLVLMADTSPLQNSYLAREDNAAFGLALAGSRNRPVVFMESFHGYAEASGLAAIPLRWRWALALMALAGLLWMAAHVRRLGPPDVIGRPLPPARREFVDALATTLGRSEHKQAAIEPVRERGRELLRLRLGLAPTAGDEEIARAAQASGRHQAEATALLRPVRSEEDVLRAGRAMITLTRGET